MVKAKSSKKSGKLFSIQLDKQKLEEKFHFCFSVIDLKKSNIAYKLIEKLLDSDKFRNSIVDLAYPDHHASVTIDSEKIIHVDFIGDDWTEDESDKVFLAIKHELKKNKLYFVFMDYLDIAKAIEGKDENTAVKILNLE